MDENNTQQPGTTPDMTEGYGQQPVQPDVTGSYGQQPVQPDMTGYYGQQPAQPDMAGYYGQQPVQPQVGGKKPKKPMTKGKLAAIIGGSVAVVALVVCGVIFLPRIFRSDKEVVLDALEETIDFYSSNDELNDLVGYDDIVDAMRKKGATKSVAINFGAGEDAAYNVGLTIDGATDQKKKELSANLKATVGDSELISADVYADEEKMYVSMPEMANGYIAYPTENTMQAIAESPLGQAMGLDTSSVPSASMNLFGQQTSGTGLTSGYVDALETVWDAAKFEKQGRAKITVNGETVTAKEYYVTWSKEDLQDACIAAIDGLTEAVTESDTALQDSGISVDDYKYYMEQLKALVPSIIKNDLQVKVYVKGKKAVKLTCKDTVSIMMAKLDYDFYIDAGDDDLSGNLSFSVGGNEAGIKFESHDVKANAYGTVSLFYGDNSIDLDFTKDIVESGDVRTVTTKLSATDYLSVEWVKSFNKSDNTFEGTLSADIIGADTYVVDYKGGWKDIKKGVGYTVALDSVEVKAANRTICTASMSEMIDTGNITVTAKDESLPVYDIVSMTEDEWNQFGQDNQASIEAWMNRLAEDSHISDLISALQDLFGTDTSLDDDESQDLASDSDSDIYADQTLEDSALMSYDDAVKYKINGTIDGFKFNYSNDYTVSFTTNDYSYMDYEIVAADSLEAALDDSFVSVADIDSYEMKDSQLHQTAKVDDKDVLYNVESYVAFDNDSEDVTGVVELEPGYYLVITASVNTEDYFTVEQLLQAFSSKYYEKIN